jgi:hypothetical protein
MKKHILKTYHEIDRFRKSLEISLEFVELQLNHFELSEIERINLKIKQKNLTRQLEKVYNMAAKFIMRRSNDE